MLSLIGVAPYVEAFDRLLNGSVAEFLRNSRTLEGDVKTHVSISTYFHSSIIVAVSEYLWVIYTCLNCAGAESLQLFYLSSSMAAMLEGLSQM